jgi:hypothetical protein
MLYLTISPVTQNYIISNDNEELIRQSQPNLEYYFGIWLESLIRTTKNLSQDSLYLDDNSDGGLSEYKTYHLCNIFHLEICNSVHLFSCAFFYLHLWCTDQKSHATY